MSLALKKILQENVKNSKKYQEDLQYINNELQSASKKGLLYKNIFPEDLHFFKIDETYFTIDDIINIFLSLYPDIDISYHDDEEGQCFTFYWGIDGETKNEKTIQ